METKAPYVMVGAFLVAMALGLGGFVAWMVGYRADAPDRYHIFFNGDVTGLAAGSPVQMRGIPVGRVAAIDIDPADIERIRVTIDLNPGTPVKTDTRARLDRAGFTGGVFVQLFGMTADTAMLTAGPGQPVPVILSEASALAQLVEGAPDMVANANALMQRAQRMFSEKNLRSIEGLLTNADRTLESFSRTAADMNREMDRMSGDIRQLVANLSSITTNFDSNIDLVRGEALTTLGTVREAAARFETMAAAVEAVTVDSRPGMKTFTENGLYEMTLLMNETRALVSTLNRIADQFERDPARFLFGDAQRGYQPR